LGFKITAAAGPNDLKRHDRESHDETGHRYLDPSTHSGDSEALEFKISDEYGSNTAKVHGSTD
jgi:hypothetical protein